MAKCEMGETAVSGGQSFGYDANGNMTSRTDLTGAYTQDFDVENRLTSVTKIGVGTTTFAYDASGQRVKTVQPDGRILYTPFPTYEEEVWPVAATTPIVTLTANGQTAVTIPPNTAYALQWQASNAFACEAGGSWSGSRPTSGSETMPGFSSGSRTYSLTCFNSAGSTSQTVTVTIGNLPAVTFTANGSYPNLPLKPGASFTLAWSSSGATTCVASGSWSGGKPTSGSQLMPGFSIGSRTYTLTCSNSYGATTRSIVATVMTIDPCGGSICLETSSTASTMALVTEGQTVIQRSTYSLAGQAIAVRVAGSPLATNNGLFYLYSDHASALLSTGLGSASAIVTSGGQKVNETRYLPFGGYRSGGPNALTDRGFTGQKENMELGLLYYNARFYAPGLGRFLSADSIVPNPTNPQSLNRYSYTRNSPLNLIDPTGHRDCGANDDCSKPLSHEPLPLPHWFPSIAPSGLTDRPYGSPEFNESGPGGQQAYDGLKTLQEEGGGWWGEIIDAQEAMMLALNHEFGNLWEEYGGPIHETLEVSSNRYESFCSGGTWSTECFNGFWAYIHPITDLGVHAADRNNARTNERYENPDFFEILSVAADNILTGNVQGSKAPFQYGNAVNDMPAFLNGDRKAYWMHIYYSNGNPYQIFVILTSGQHTGTLE